ncbi:MAG: anaerobic sulfatase maturase [Herbinix sp.]|jgi:uncharacterized protein|nr:anaerobic sulfatase maturase [Herbinix sp.]
MNSDTMEHMIREAFAYADQGCSFAFQGGEPTMAGLDYFIEFIEIVQKYNIKKIPVNYSMQTNGMLMNDEWCAFLKDNKFLIGLSLDGPKEIHNRNRKDANQEGTFKNVMKTVELFHKHKIEYNILSVITAQSARSANLIYGFFKKNNLTYLQFIPCLDPLNEKQGQRPYSLKPEHYERFLKDTFDLWYKDITNGEYVSIRYFDNLIRMILGFRPEACSMNGICQCQFVVEADGSVYPCDFYVVDQWRLGSIRENTVVELLNCDATKKFIQISVSNGSRCNDCKWYTLCRGGCARERDHQEGISTNYYCKAYYSFLEYAYPRLKEVARMIANKSSHL